MLTQCNLSFDHDEGTEGESDSEVITPGTEISQPEPALVESDDVVVPFDNVSTQQRVRGGHVLVGSRLGVGVPIVLPL